jgi:uncharacterized protein YukE
MDDFRMRPKGDYLHKADWPELYVLTEQWKSDMEFYKDELHFFNDLIGKFFIKISGLEKKNKVEQMLHDLHELQKQSSELEQAIQNHMHHIGRIIENPFSQDGNRFRDEHEQLENNMNKFSIRFKELKTEVFGIAELAMENFNSKNLLTT